MNFWMIFSFVATFLSLFVQVHPVRGDLSVLVHSDERPVLLCVTSVSLAVCCLG